MNKILLALLIFALGVVSPKSYSQEVAEEAVESAAETATETSDSGSKNPAAPIRHKDKPKLKLSMKSKLTSDRSEEAADHRVLEPIAIGVDKIIDLETKEVTSAKNVYKGNITVVEVASVFDSSNKFVRQLVLKGMGEGETNIILRNSKGDVLVIFDVTVAKQNLIRIYTDLKKDLKEVEGIEIRPQGTRVVIDGEVLTPNDYGKVVNVIADPIFKDVVLNRVTMSVVSLNALSKKIETDLQVIAPTVTVSVLNGRIILNGTVDSDALKSRCFKRAQFYLPSILAPNPLRKATAEVDKNEALDSLQLVQNEIQTVVPPPKRESKLVRLTVYFVELSKDFLKNNGFKWQPGFTSDPTISIGQNATGATGANAGGASGGLSFTATLSSLFPFFNTTPASASYGRVLKTVTGVVKSQEALNIKDVQNLPTSVIGAQGQVTAGAPIEVGMQVEVTPSILQGQDVDLSIDIDQNDVVGKGIGGTPITARHKLKSRIYVKSGEVAGIAAVTNQDVSSSFNRDDPNAGTFAAGTRPLVTLQRSKNYSKKRSQFVVFISPQIVESASEGTEDLKKNYRMPSGQH